jgi:hypothetical protein
MSKTWIKIIGFGLIAGCIAIFGYSWYIYHQIDIRVGKGLISNPLCTAPCWQGITPGITSRSDALLIVQGMNVRSFKIEGNEEKGECRWGWPIFSFGRSLNKITWKNQIVSEIHLGTNLTMKDIILQFGTPYRVNISLGGTPEHWYWVINMFYPSKRARFIAFTEEYNDEISESTVVGIAVYYAEFTEESPIDWRSDLEPWKGYGNVKRVYEVP